MENGTGPEISSKVEQINNNINILSGRMDQVVAVREMMRADDENSLIKKKKVTRSEIRDLPTVNG